MFLKADRDLHLVGEAEDGAQALQLAHADSLNLGEETTDTVARV